VIKILNLTVLESYFSEQYVGKSRNPLQRVVTRCNTDQTGYENCRSSCVRAKAVFGFNRVVTMSPGVPMGVTRCMTAR